MAMERGDSSKNYLLTFLLWSARNPNLLSLNYQKAGIFSPKIRLKLLYVNALIINQPAPIRSSHK